MTNNTKTRRISFEEALQRKLKNPSFREEFERQGQALRLGVQIARLRKELGISQNELAARAGMRKQNLSRLERPDYRGFSLATLQRIAGALDREVEVRFVTPSR